MGSTTKTHPVAMPRAIKTEKSIEIPEGVTVQAKARQVTVSGPRGKLSRNFKHLQVQIEVRGNRVYACYWFGARREIAKVQTVLAHINNLIKGVTRGFETKMRFVYAHFPVNVTISKDKKNVEIRNFLGEKVVRVVDMRDGVTCERSDKVKDEIILTGNDIDLVSQSAADIQQICLVKRKDILSSLTGSTCPQRASSP